METFESALKFDEGCLMISKAGHHFSCSDVTISKAMLIYHHYQNLRKMRGSRKEKTIYHLFATAAFTLSTQICEENIKIEEAIEFLESLSPYFKREPCVIDMMKKKLKRVQYDMHRVVFGARYRSKYSRNNSKDLVLNCATAHRYVFHYMHQFSYLPEIGMEDLRSVKKLSLKHTNTFYNCPKCTTYTPLEIAWAAMHIALEEYEIDIKQIYILKKELSKAVKAERHQIAKHDMWQVVTLGFRMLKITLSIE